MEVPRGSVHTYLHYGQSQTTYTSLRYYPKNVWDCYYKQRLKRRGVRKKLIRGLQTEHREIVNVSSYNLSWEEILALQKGLSFCPDQDIDIFECIKDVNLFARKLFLKVLLDKFKTEKPNYTEMFTEYTVADFWALKDLILLMQDNQELDSLDSSILNQDISSPLLGS